jgi:uncharacterized protein YkwD
MAAKTKKITKPTKAHRKNSVQHPKHFLKVYWPYIPLIVLVVFGVFFSNVNPRQRNNTNSATLAYATEMSRSGLLSSTNSQRASNGLGPLTLNAQLNSSAQAKADDMTARDYWAHNTPDGQEPWIFFDAAGYSYQKAGENLAYGFSTSDATVIGWMNSPSHRANMLDNTYTEVGFGYTNASNFTGTGEETVVVAHYAKPTVATTTPAPTPAPKPSSLPSTTQKSPTPAPKPVPTEQVIEEPVTAPAEEVVKPGVPNDKYNQPITSEATVPDDVPSKNITRLQWLTQGKAPWSAVVLSGIVFAVVIVWLIKHAILVKRFVLKGEYFVAHHPLLDLAVVTIAAVAVYLSQSSGVVL